MKTFLFQTVVTENSSDFWIDRDIVKDFKVSANNLTEAKKAYFEFVKSESYITISKTQQKKANKMYIDTKSGETVQTGFVFIGSTEVEFSNEWKKRFVSLWCTINEFVNPFND